MLAHSGALAALAGTGATELTAVEGIGRRRAGELAALPRATYQPDAPPDGAPGREGAPPADR